MAVQLCAYQPSFLPGIRAMLSRIGWDEPYIVATERNAETYGSGPPLWAQFAVEGDRLIGLAVGYQLAYEMPRYYEDGLDGGTYQKFFR